MLKSTLRLFFTLLLLLQISCKNNPEPSNSFESYSQVEEYLDDGSFEIDEETDTSKSSFITSARYQSPDGETGFLTLGMRGELYHFQDVPVDVWEDFKDAESKGSFYHSNIKGNYNIDFTVKNN